MTDIRIFSQLNELQRLTLCFMAYGNREPEGTLMASFCREFQVKDFDVMEALRKLTGNGFLLYNEKKGRTVAEKYRMSVLFYLFESHHSWVKKIERALPYSYIDQENRHVIDFVLAVLEGWPTELRTTSSIHSNQIIRLCCPIYEDERIMSEIGKMPLPNFKLFISELLSWLIEHDIAASETLMKLWNMNPANRLALEQEWYDCMLYRFYATGIQPEESIDSWQGDIINGTVALTHGDRENAYEHFIKAARRSGFGSARNPFPDFITNYLFPLAVFATQTPDGRIRLSKISQELYYGNKRDMNSTVLSLMSNYLKDSRRFVDDMSIRYINEKAKQRQSMGYACLSFLLCSLMKRYREIDLNSQGYSPNLWIFRNELSAVMPYLNSQDIFHPVFSISTTSHYTSIPSRNTIQEHSVTSKTQHIQKAAPHITIQEHPYEEDSDTYSRLVYVISSSLEITPYIETIDKNTGLLSFSPVSTLDYRFGRIPKSEISNIDRQIWTLWYNSNNRFPVDPVISRLAQSDKLYVLHEGQISQAKLILDPLALDIQQEASGYRVVSNYSHDKIRTARNCVYNILPDRVLYSPLPESCRNLLLRLLHHGFYTIESEEQLHQMIVQLGNNVIVKGDSYAAGRPAPVKTGGKVLVIQITEKKNTKNIRSVCIKSKPLPESEILCNPGEGGRIVKVYINGQRFNIERDLNAEVESKRLFLADMESEGCHLEPTEQRNADYTITAQDLLVLIDYVLQHKGSCQLEWKTEQPLVVTTLNKDAVQLNLRKREEWLELEGKVVLDEQRSLNVREFFNAFLSEKRGFIQIGDNHYVRLEAKLKEQVERLASGFHDNGHRLIAKELSAATMAGSMKGEIEVAGSGFLNELEDKIKDSLTKDIPVPAGLMATLRPYQYEGYQWISRLAEIGAGGCLADDMGLGKTLQSIAFMLSRSEEGASVVFAPASVVNNWESEIRRFAPDLNPIVLNSGRKRKEVIEKSGHKDIIIASYGLLVSMKEELSAKQWCCICLDEAHTIKNKMTQTSDAVMSLSGRYRLALTGTPIQNNLSELWNIFQFINPGFMGGYESFSRKFVSPIMNNRDLNRQEQLKRLISPFMMRRTKAEVAKELPHKEEKTILVNLTNGEMEAYEHVRIEAKAKTEENNMVEILAEITRLRLAACCTKLISKNWTGKSSKLSAFQITLDQILSKEDSRVLIFSQFTSFLSMAGDLMRSLGLEFLYLDGSTPIKERTKLVESFQKGKCRIFLISLQAGGLGLNLTAADNVILMDPWWNPAIEQQAIDRAYRIGQQRDVTVYHLISSNTIEEKIVRLQQTKKDLASALLAGEEMSKGISYEEIVELITSQK